jgi:molybdate transport system ATP-binding protein
MSAWFEADFEDRIGAFALNVSIRLDHGIGVLFGPSGSGKSLTLRIIAGLRNPARGTIRLGNETLFSGGNVRKRLLPQQRRISLLFQNLALFPHMTALENVLFGCRKAGSDARAFAAEQLETMRLSGFENRYPSQLSGGQRQRVALARALASEPEMLLLDEPFSALDGPLRRSLRNELRTLQRETNIPVLYVTHQLDDLCALGDRVIVMKEGRTERSFAVETLWKNGERGEAWHLLGWGNFFRGDVRSTERGTEFSNGTLSLNTGTLTRYGPAGAFVPPDRIRLLSPGVPVDPALAPNMHDGAVEEITPLGGTARIYVEAAHTLWQIEVSPDLIDSLDIHLGSSVRFSILPKDVEIAYP